MAIAFFDLDKTLLADNSARLWLKDQWNTRQIKFGEMLYASYWLAKYHLGFTNLEDVVAKSLTVIAGQPKEYILQQTRNFFEHSIKNIYRPGAVDALARHRKNGDIISLLTSSFDGLSLLVTDDLKLDHCLCTFLEVDDNGMYTGKTIGPPCFGKNKITYADQLCTQLGISLRQCWFYSDSASDIPLLNLVGHAVAVNPDPHLRARAQLNKWTVVDWGKPEWTHKQNK